MDLSKEIIIGEKAKELANNEAFIIAFDEVKKMYVREWMGTDAGDVKRREQLWIAVGLLDAVMCNILAAADGGEIALMQLNMKGSM